MSAAVVPPALAGTHRAQVDLRLVPGAITVWSVTLLGLHTDHLVVVLTGTGLCGAAALAARAPRWRNAALVVLVLAGASAGCLGLRLHQVERHPLHAAAERGEKRTVRFTLERTLVPLQGASYGARRAQDTALAHVELESGRSDGRWHRFGGAALVLASTEQWRHLIPGQQVTATVRVLPAHRGDLLVAVLRAAGPPRQVAEAPWWERVAEQLRDGLRTASATLGPQPGALLPGLVVGDTGKLPPPVVRQFEVTGLSHLLAVSGANLAIVSGAVLLALRWVGASPLVCAGGAGVALLGFVVLAGPEPSVLRAAVMGAIALLALVLGRERSALPALAAATVGLLLLQPELAASPGFALSVLATCGLVLLAPSWAAALHGYGVPVGLAEAIAVPAAAQVVTAPVVAGLSGEVSIVAVVANMLAAPVVAPATVLGVLATIIAPLWTEGAWICALLAWPELEWMLGIARIGSSLPTASVDWPAGVAGGLGLAAATVIVLFLLRSPKIRWTAGCLLLICCIVLLPVRAVRPGWPTPGWSAVLCDVGQGDGIVLATGVRGEAVVIDTGPDPAPIGECLRRLHVQRVSLLMLSHLHADHVSGVDAVLSGSAVGAVAVGSLREPDWAMAEVSRAATRERVPVVELRAGQRMRWPGLVIEVIGPAGALARAAEAEDANDASLVLRATTRAGRMLFTGDIELRGQSAILASGADIRADVLKVPHHGSKYTSPAFLAAIRPRVALISVGDGNSYGHPSPLIVRALTRSGTRVVRTDQAGDIAVMPGPHGPRVASRGDPIQDGR